ncbi:hypothetical protein ACQ8YR_002620 [Yersinia enterocolitica]|nr:hypothetical protein [Yersinia enterocolitica]EKN5021405.1 hypothetical protein [Yersinia enterocolitica]EKN5065978.1 hypothetical protein [Yersinia enterocolitica]EKN5131627.1 hypothetical protein [Yersinia enterocolitica]HDL6991959.1 hypothetical protein [Yersinia enterocolitica]
MALRYMNIIKSIEILEKKKNRKQKKLSDRLQRNSLLIIAISITLALLTLFISKLIKSEFILSVSILLLVLSYFTIFLIPFIDLYKNRKGTYKSFALPFNHAINTNVKKQSIVDYQKLPKLLELSIRELEFGLMEIKHEKSFLEKRMQIIVGPIEKLGIFPGILAILGMTFKIDSQSQWPSIIAYSYIGLMLVSITLHHTLARYERMITLTELALSLKKDNK